MDRNPSTERVMAVRQGLVTGLLVASLGSALLAIFQWFELLRAQEGGTPLCAISHTLSCTAVWDSAFAKAVHRVTHLPVAGWGLVWGLTGLGTSALVFVRRAETRPPIPALAAVWITALAGIAVSVGLFGMSTRMGVYCVTCFGTYSLVGAFSLFALKLPRPDRFVGPDWIGGFGRALVFVVLGYLVLLYPGLRTPVEASAKASLSAPAPSAPSVKQGSTTAVKKSSGDLLSDFFVDLPPAAKQAVSDAVQAFRESLPEDTSRWPKRKEFSADGAPVRIVEFTDVRCIHCRTLAEVMHEIERTVPPGAFSLELRQFPLDSACNPNVPKEIHEAGGVRCAAAKALICLEQGEHFREAQAQMFREQIELTVNRVMEIASGTGVSAKDLERCMRSKETESRLSDDIAYATHYKIEGTPLVLVNGRRATSVAPFLYGMIVSGGDLGAPGWRLLPPPRASEPEK